MSVPVTLVSMEHNAWMDWITSTALVHQVLREYSVMKVRNMSIVKQNEPCLHFGLIFFFKRILVLLKIYIGIKPTS